MLDGVFVNAYIPPAFDKKEILRYAGCKEADEYVERLLEECLKECENVFSYRVCYRVFEKETFMRTFGRESKNLAKNLANCEYVVAFGASVGLAIDRLIVKYGGISTAKALFFQAIGTERIEALCDAFCEDMKAQAEKKNFSLRPRFSPGYGDFPLQVQKDLCMALDCSRKIGLNLTESLLMTPTKSVTAIVGIEL